MSLAICDRCGTQWKHNQLQFQTVKQKRTNLLVCPDCLDVDHPQLMLGTKPVIDRQVQRDARPDHDDSRTIDTLFDPATFLKPSVDAPPPTPQDTVITGTLFSESFTASDGTLISEHNPDSNQLGWQWYVFNGFPESTINNDQLVSSGTATGYAWLFNVDQQLNWMTPDVWQMTVPWTFNFRFNNPDVSGGSGSVQNTLILSGSSGALTINNKSSNSVFAGPTTTEILLDDGQGHFSSTTVDPTTSHTVSVLIEADGITLTVDGVVGAKDTSLIGITDLFQIQTTVSSVLPGISVNSTDVNSWFDDISISGTATLVPGSQT